MTSSSRVVTSSKFRYRRELSNSQKLDHGIASTKSLGCSSTNFCSKQSLGNHMNKYTAESLGTDIMRISTSKGH